MFSWLAAVEKLAHHHGGYAIMLIYFFLSKCFVVPASVSSAVNKTWMSLLCGYVTVRFIPFDRNVEEKIGVELRGCIQYPHIGLRWGALILTCRL